MVRRVIIMAPDKTSTDKAMAKLASKRLVDKDGVERGYIVPSEMDAVFSDYLSSSNKWTSVTSVIGAYDNGDKEQRMRNVIRMFEHAGLRVPTKVDVLPVHGDATFVSAHHKHLPRFKVTAEWKQPMSGVVAVGAGRYAGLKVLLKQRTAPRQHWCRQSDRWKCKKAVGRLGSNQNGSHRHQSEQTWVSFGTHSFRD